MTIMPNISSESDLRKLIHEIWDFGPRKGIPYLFKSKIQFVDKKLYSSLFYCLSIHGSPWRGALHKSISPRGSCPNKLKRTLKTILDDIEQKKTGITIPEALRKTRIGTKNLELHIDNKEELGIGKEQKNLIHKINELYSYTDSGFVNLNIHFHCDRVLIYGLALIATWCSRYAADVKIETDNAVVDQYLRDSGYMDVISNKKYGDTAIYDSKNHVALTQILNEKKEDPGRIADRLIQLISNHMYFNKEKRGDLCTIFTELIENVYRHAQSPHQGYVLAQAHPNTGYLHFVIVDNGIGIYDSFRRCNNPLLRSRCKSEKESLNLAIEKFITSKEKNHSGYGLYITSELCKLNRGYFRITSGENTLIIDGNTKKTNYDTNNRWNGTEIGIEFNINNDLPLSEVYKTLKPIDEEEDFFDE